MTTKEIAERLVALCRQGQVETAQRELYAADAINIEPYATIKGHGRVTLDELCIYAVEDGKIISERFTSRFPF